MPYKNKKQKDEAKKEFKEQYNEEHEKTKEKFFEKEIGVDKKRTKYSAELAEKICDLVGSSHKGLVEHNEEHDWFPNPRTIHRWVYESSLLGEDSEDEKKGFCQMYTKAIEMKCLLLADQTLKIADYSAEDLGVDENGKEFVNNEIVQRSRIRIDTRKWWTAKFYPKVFGEKVAVDNTSSDGSMSPKVIQYQLLIPDNGTGIQEVENKNNDENKTEGE